MEEFKGAGLHYIASADFPLRKIPRNRAVRRRKAGKIGWILFQVRKIG